MLIVYEHDLASVPLEKASAGILIGRGLLIALLQQNILTHYHAGTLCETILFSFQCFLTSKRIISSNIKQANIFLSLSYLALCCKKHANVQSFLLQYRPKPYHNAFIQVNVGSFPGDWSDVKPNHVENDSIAVSSEPTLSPIQSAWAKYGMIAYVAHMCAFLPLSLIPTYIQTKLGR